MELVRYSFHQCASPQWLCIDMATAAVATKTTKALVVGAGAAGLRTALELARRNVPVCVRAPTHLLDSSNCSPGAGGLWMPFHCDDARVDGWAMETLGELMPLAKADDNDLVEIVPAVLLKSQNKGPTVDDFAKHEYEKKAGGHTPNDRLPKWTQDDRIEFQHLTVNMLLWQNIVARLRLPPEDELHEAGYLYSWFFKPPIVNAPKMLQHYVDELSERGADIELQTNRVYTDVIEMCHDAARLGCDTVINCTGLGAGVVANDDTVLPARGILHLYDRASCTRRAPVRDGLYGANANDAVIMTDDPPWGSATEPAYLIPRGNLIAVGGSYGEHDTELSISTAENERLLRNAARLGIDTSRSQPVRHWTGFRPVRPTVRCELDSNFINNANVQVAHCYGFGGSGWTINTGAARELADVLVGDVAMT